MGGNVAVATAARGCRGEELVVEEVVLGGNLDGGTWVQGEELVMEEVVVCGNVAVAMAARGCRGKS